MSTIKPPRRHGYPAVVFREGRHKVLVYAYDSAGKYSRAATTAAARRISRTLSVGARRKPRAVKLAA